MATGEDYTGANLNIDLKLFDRELTSLKGAPKIASTFFSCTSCPKLAKESFYDLLDSEIGSLKADQITEAEFREWQTVNNNIKAFVTMLKLKGPK
jgi:hypothetical protein